MVCADGDARRRRALVIRLEPLVLLVVVASVARAQHGELHACRLDLCPIDRAVMFAYVDTFILCHCSILLRFCIGERLRCVSIYYFPIFCQHVRLTCQPTYNDRAVRRHHVDVRIDTRCIRSCRFFRNKSLCISAQILKINNRSFCKVQEHIFPIPTFAG